ncbi:hypothetical protein GCM10010363_72750 [Streptomyces omiyaensis]|nr:hypothetical protein GCM10010363_72750 [Streptomyces omiyaensis]
MDVVTGVADDRDLRVRDGLLEAAKETGTTDATGQNHNAHADSVSAAARSPEGWWPGRAAPPGGGRGRAGRQAVTVSRPAGAHRPWYDSCIGMSVRPGK